MGFEINGNGVASNVLEVPGGYTVMADTGIVESTALGVIGPTATVKYKVLDAAQRFNFVNQLLGVWTGAPPANIFYIAPFAYPASPNLICTSVPEIKGFGRPVPEQINGVGLPYLYNESSIVTAVFTRPQWAPADNGGYFTVTFAGGGEFFTIPETTYQFADGTPTNTPIGIQLGGATITVTRYRMPFLPDQAMVALAGHVNLNPFIIGNVTYAAGFLLFMPGNSSIESDPTGNITYKSEYIFQYRSQPWNFYFHPNRTTGFAQVTDGNSNPVYPSADFSILP